MKKPAPLTSSLLSAWKNITHMAGVFSLCISTLFSTGCSVAGIRTAEEPSYVVVEKHDNIEIREYPALLLAETTTSAPTFREASNKGFRKLAAFIFGDNQKSDKIQMTAPVLREEGTSIAMTAPVFREAGEGDEGKKKSWKMQFVMPGEYNVDTLPKPLDESITILTQPAKLVASLQFSGSMTEEDITSETRNLEHWVQSSNYSIASAPRSAAYDPPWTIPALKRNEVHFDVERRTKEDL